jgi:hypothetical protein
MYIGCSKWIPDYTLSRGQYTIIERRFELIFVNEKVLLPDKSDCISIDIPFEAGLLIAADTIWSVPEGLIVNEAAVFVSNLPFSYETVSTYGGYRYTYRHSKVGILVSIKARIEVSPSCSKGLKIVSLRLPSLSKVASKFNAKLEALNLKIDPEDYKFRLKFDTDRFSRPDNFNIATILVQ